MHSASISESHFQNVNTTPVIKNVFIVITQENSWEAGCAFNKCVFNNPIEYVLPGTDTLNLHVHPKRQTEGGGIPQNDRCQSFPFQTNSHKSQNGEDMSRRCSQEEMRLNTETAHPC